MSDMQRLIIQMAQAVDHMGQDPQAAALEAVKRVVSQASICAPDTLGVAEHDVLVRITIGVPSQCDIDLDALAALNTHGRTEIVRQDGGMRFRGCDKGIEPIVVTAAAEIFLPKQTGWRLR